MKLPVVEILPKDLPEPLAAYWNSPHRLNREYRFFLIQGEIYILDSSNNEEPYLLYHWTTDSCAGIGCLILGYYPELNREEIPQRRDLPLVGLDGQYLFEVLYTNDYETSIRRADGKMFVVHSG